MTGSGTREYVLELDVEADPIEGRVRDGSDEFDFTGWLGLASALERLISSPESAGNAIKQGESK